MLISRLSWFEASAGTLPASLARSARWLLACLLVVPVALSQTASAQDLPASTPPARTEVEDGPEEADRYWIFLHRRAASPTAAAIPQETGAQATPEARERRALRGERGTEWLTRPVPDRALHQLRTAGVEPIVVSRWLHAVSARLTPTTADRLLDLPVVSRIRPTATYTVANAGATGAERLALRPPFTTTFRPIGPSDEDATRAPDRSFSSSFGVFAPSAPDSLTGPGVDQIAAINAHRPMQRGVIGRGVRIGFLDAGYKGLRHPAFDALNASGRVRALRDFTEREQDSNHGKGVVSAAMGYDPGVLYGPAYGAEVVAATTEYTPTETNVEEDYFVAGLEWLEEQGVDLVNVSLGYTEFDEGEDSYGVSDLDGDTGVTTRAVDAAAQLGMIVVVSAGNSSCGSPDECWYYVGTPADADSAIAVGGVEQDSTRASFSSQGPTADGRIKPDVAAPAVRVVAAWEGNEYAALNGTSFASPLVSGVVAQMLQQNPRLRPMQVRDILRRTASQSDNPDNQLGWGIVDADAAVRAAERLARREPPSALSVSRPYPQPASSSVTFDLRAPSRVNTVEVSFYDVLGRQRLTVDRTLQPGPNTVRVPVDDLAPGVYLYRLRSGSSVETGKVVVVR